MRASERGEDAVTEVHATEPHGSSPGPGQTAAPAPSGFAPAAGGALGAPAREHHDVDLAQRREELTVRFAELQYDLGGILYEMAIRDHIRLDVLVAHAATLQDVDAELREVERILHLEESATAGSCGHCGAPHSSGAAYCWQCGQRLLEHVSLLGTGGA